MSSQNKTDNGLVSVVAALTGILFGIGLGVSEMANPARVLGFLDVFGSWDPTLVFVMLGALLISTPGFQLARRMGKPLLTLKFIMPGRKDIDKRLVAGSALFGIGWGLAGLCPGPALVALSTFDPRALMFVLAMAAGALFYQYVLD